MSAAGLDEYGTVEVLPQHGLDIERLQAYLQDKLPNGAQEFSLRQFQGGQSNPTYLIIANQVPYVLRKKPPGELLRGAHQVDREFHVMHALRDSLVPVPDMIDLCEDTSIVGTEFFVMQYLNGRVEQEPTLDDFDVDQRKPIFANMATTLAHLHSVDWQAAGLENFGRAENYIDRQIKTWTRQYEAAKIDELPAMDKLIEWLHARPAPESAATIVHGDYRVGNIMFDSVGDSIQAVLDWELSTIGHPLADLGYFCMPWYLPADIKGVRGLRGRDLAVAGLPSVDEIVRQYSSERGIDGVPDLEYFVAFSLFRLVAIVQGVYARGLAGNASNADALEVGGKAALLADIGWEVASRNN